ncbi:cupin domain-containing protein [Pasteurellaceae bacterium 22721_9_1]
MKLKTSLAVIMLSTVAFSQMASAEAAEKKEYDRSIQLYKKAELATWDRENAGGGEGPLLGKFAYTRHDTGSQDAFQEVGWLTLPKGASIGKHKHNDNEDVYIIVSGKGLFVDSNGKESIVEAGDITIARPGQSHGLKNIGDDPLIFINTVAKRDQTTK